MEVLKIKFLQLKAYVYPNIDQNRLGSKNPYISNLKTSLFENGFIINLKYSENAFINLLKNGYSSDYLILNWVEDISSKRMGLAQMIIFYCFILLYKFNGKTIVWIKHNKISHSKSNWKFKKAMQSFLVSKASLILTHSKETGLGKLDNLVFTHHPNTIAANKILTPSYHTDTTIDFLIWGSIIPYKGVLEFLQFAYDNESFNGIKIRVVGKCDDANYFNELNKYQSEDIRIDNKFISNEELNQLYSKSKFILFTYKSASVMSSGTLIESLCGSKRIIGPACGAFKDLQEEGFVTTYSSFENIMAIYHDYQQDYILNREKLCDFIKASSWLNFGSQLRTILSDTSKTNDMVSILSKKWRLKSNYIKNQQ